MSTLDNTLITLDSALRTVFAHAHATRARPDAQHKAADLSEAEQKHAAGLMRVNHVGEVCAQALYTAQAFATQDARLRAHFLDASKEETDHLAWTEQRLRELSSHKSILNPLWYAGAFAIGLAAGKLAGDQVSLGFVVETENQVSAHLDSHLEHSSKALPAADTASRAIVAQMKQDEIEHAHAALQAGAVALPRPIQNLMRAAAKVMTTVAYRV